MSLTVFLCSRLTKLWRSIFSLHDSSIKVEWFKFLYKFHNYSATFAAVKVKSEWGKTRTTDRDLFLLLLLLLLLYTFIPLFKTDYYHTTTTTTVITLAASRCWVSWLIVCGLLKDYYDLLALFAFSRNKFRGWARVSVCARVCVCVWLREWGTRLPYFFLLLTFFVCSMRGGFLVRENPASFYREMWLTSFFPPPRLLCV